MAADRGRGKITPMDEQEVERRAMEAVRRDGPRLRDEYRRKFGSEISTDNAREIISPEYASSKAERTRLSRATQKPAGMLADELFDEALKSPYPDRPKIILMTAGGTGAGKTASLLANPDLVDDSQFVYDSNLSSKKSSVRKIEAAKTFGYRVHIIFTHRDPIEALTGGVLPRAMEEGRIVGLDAHARMYRDAAENIRFLIRRYFSDPAVRFLAIDNTGGKGLSHPMPLEETAKIRYSTIELGPRLRTALEQEYAAGRISGSVYRATLGPSSTAAS